MKLDFVLIADAAQVGERAKLAILGGGITRIEPPTMPFLLPRIAVILRLLMEDADLNIGHDVEFRWIRPTGETIGPPLKSVFTLEKQQTHPGEEQAIVLVAESGLLLQESGTHLLEVYVDGQPVSRRPIAIITPEKQAGPSA
jgi:hypothetical protein